MNKRTKSDGRRGRMIRFSDDEWNSLKAACRSIHATVSETIRRLAASLANNPQASPCSARMRVFACAYCTEEFSTEFDADAHIDAQHPEEIV